MAKCEQCGKNKKNLIDSLLLGKICKECAKENEVYDKEDEEDLQDFIEYINKD